MYLSMYLRGACNYTAVSQRYASCKLPIHSWNEGFFVYAPNFQEVDGLSESLPQWGINVMDRAISVVIGG
ncbi:MAG: hypothetical protein H7A25_01160 [Leptospiraceae bacterium]|nr:hypothetical protein [Leptospiraceae bacterium]MCP5498484.1 hypothetical protein [Leptospiraceae bacterium]